MGRVPWIRYGVDRQSKMLGRHLSSRATAGLKHALGASRREQHQSPIEIESPKAITSSELLPLNLSSNWEEPVNGFCTNTGYYFQFDPDSSSVSRRVSTHLGSYVLKQFHFHWGETSGEGSEHMVDGTRYDIEAHIVLGKEGAVETPKSGDTAVIGVFGVINHNLDANDSIWGKLSPGNLLTAHSTNRIDGGIKCLDLLPRNLDYYYYQGSPTTPPFDIVYEWFVLKEPIRIPPNFISDLRGLQDGQGKNMCNCRPLQNLEERVIRTPKSNL